MDDSFASPKKLSPTSSSMSKNKKAAVPKLVSDKLEVGDALRGAHSTCPVCQKDLERLSDLRRAVHVNTCVDESLNKKAVEEATKQAESMFVCSFCHEAVAKGPYLIAHANKCAKAFDMSVQKMITALEVQSQVTDKLRKNGIQKDVPITTEMIKKAKKRILEQSKEKNASDSDSAPSPKVAKVSNRSGLLRSVVFGMKEKHSCRCEGLHVIQNRFCDQFKRKKIEEKGGRNKEILEENMFQKKLSKIDRLSRLADDFRRTMFSGKGDVKLIAKNGIKILAHSFVLNARTTLLNTPTTTEVMLDEFSNDVIDYYLHYVYCGSVDWSVDEMEDIRKLASLYGPTDLYLMMTQSDEVYHGSQAPVKPFDYDEVESCDVGTCNDTPLQLERKGRSPLLFESYNENSIEVIADSTDTLRKQSDSPDSIIIDEVITSNSMVYSRELAKSSSKVEDLQPISPFQKPKTQELCRTPTLLHAIPIQPSYSNDSFFSDSPFPPKPSDIQQQTTESNTPVRHVIPPTSPILSPTSKARKLASKLRSGVKVVKFSNITPMPTYEKFTEAELKGALAVFGIRPCGRKTAIEILKKIYNELHPIITDVTATNTPKRHISPIPFEIEKSTSETSNCSQENTDEGFNHSVEENLEESLFFDADESIGPLSGSSPTKQPKQIKDVDVAVKTMLEWLRLSENYELYTNILSFRIVNLDELMGIISRSSHDVRKITKKILPDVLDRLYIAFHIPDKKWKRRGGYKCG